MRILIIGAGNAGQQLAERLCDEKHSVLMIDSDPQRLAEAEAGLDILTLCGPGSSPRVLDEAKIEKCQLLIAVTDCDEVNILACLYAHVAGVDRKVARVSSPEYIHKDDTYDLTAMGIDLVINQKQECTREMFQLLQVPEAVEAFEIFKGRVMVAGVHVHADSPILEISPAHYKNHELIHRIRIIAVRRGDKLIIPHGDTRFKLDDLVYMVGQRADLRAFLTSVCSEYKSFEKVIIAGGGDLGLLLAKALEGRMECVLLEQNEERARHCSAELNKTLILRADALTGSALDETGIGPRTAFVALTGDDENNVMNCLMAQKKGASFTMANIMRTDYVPIVQSLGLVDRVVSPYISTAHAILHYLRSKKVQAASLLHNLPGELLDVVVSKHSCAAGRKIQEFKMPRKAIIASVLRGRDALPATGDLKLLSQDRVLVFCHPDAIKKIQSMFSK